MVFCCFWMFWNGFTPTSAPTTAFIFSSQHLLRTCSQRERGSELTSWRMTNTPLRCADTPSHSLQVSTAQHQHQPLYHKHTHAQNLTPPPHPISQGKQQRQRERERRVRRPPVPAESACQLGKARWKQSHMMAALAVAKGRCCSRCRPSLPVLSQPPCVGEGVSVAAQRWDDAEREERRSCCCCFLWAAHREWRKLSAAL